jgi:hypothetical protein
MTLWSGMSRWANSRHPTMGRQWPECGHSPTPARIALFSSAVVASPRPSRDFADVRSDEPATFTAAAQ